MRKALVIIAAAAALFAASSSAGTYGPMPAHWSAMHDTPAGWYQAALCIHGREGAWNDATGNGYEGGMQFSLPTWKSVGGPVFPDGHWASEASPREQLYRTWLLWSRDHGIWYWRNGGDWGDSALLCHLR